MTTLKEFEDALREQGMQMALAILEKLRARDRTKRTTAPARRIAGRKMTPELARDILHLHATTEMTQQEIAFQLGINQGRVNEVIKRGKWLSGSPSAPEAIARDEAVARMTRPRTATRPVPKSAARGRRKLTQADAPAPARKASDQLTLGDL
jgi:hypothetical protein